MEVTFASTKLHKCCNNDKELNKWYGKVCAKRIRTRLDDLRAACNLEFFKGFLGRCHELSGDRKGQLSLDLEHPQRLIFKPMGDGVAYKNDGGLDWKSVTAVQIIEVVDYHE